MKRLSGFIYICLLTIFLVFCISAQDFKTIQAGIEYAEVTREIDKLPVKMNLLRLDLTKVRLDVYHAKDAVIGLEKTSSIAARHGAFAAINAGFFRIDKSIFEGDDVSTLQIDGKLLSESNNNRIALGIINAPKKTEIVFGHLKTESYIGTSDKIIKTFDGINRENKKNKEEVLLYTPEFKQTPITELPITQTILSDCRSICKKVEVVQNKGGTPIPKDGYVIASVGNLLPDNDTSLKSIRIVNNFVLPNEDKELKLFKDAEDIVSGVPQLIKNGKIDVTWEQEKSSKSFFETKHPRTAIAKLKDGKFLMVTVDGRSESSGGIGLQNLAELLLEFGAVDAMNLDGGGSSTMFLDGRVVNHPSDKEGERSIGDAILVFMRKKN